MHINLFVLHLCCIELPLTLTSMLRVDKVLTAPVFMFCKSCVLRSHVVIMAIGICYMQAIATAEAELHGPQDTCDGSSGDGFTVICEPIPLDLPSCSPSTVQFNHTHVSFRILPPHEHAHP